MRGLARYAKSASVTCTINKGVQAQVLLTQQQQQQQQQTRLYSGRLLPLTQGLCRRTTMQAMHKANTTFSLFLLDSPAMHFAPANVWCCGCEV